MPSKYNKPLRLLIMFEEVTPENLDVERIGDASPESRVQREQDEVRDLLYERKRS
jgi:hypothetical protein